MLGRFVFHLVLMVIAVVAGGAQPGKADNYPSRPIALVVPYPAGGGVDAMARIVADKLSKALGQQVLVDNRGGGGGNIGTRVVAKAAPDGYTLLLGHTGTISINPSLYKDAGYVPRRDFAPIGLIATMPLGLLTHPSFPVRTVADLITLAKASPGKFNLGSSAVGTGSYVCAELFKTMAHVDMAIIPYKGTAPVITDLMGGHVPVAFGVIPPALGNVRAGNLRMLAVTSLTRTSLMPEVPTADESGLPGFEAVLHYGLLAPAGTPRPIIDRLNAVLQDALRMDDVRERIASDGAEPLWSTPEAYAADIAAEETKWSEVIKISGAKVE
ncbi:MAG TPA: tripartite tricarboxylate transporter substrate binding protein [Xanthobacteraceae bacterium]|jgi:tripartite-type tricarboxylate transporter receptor subunit TctC|nr:tripartite tricarboxylate transporter substrate binding protein [Xanthobacteraceae bacterium]